MTILKIITVVIIMLIVIGIGVRLLNPLPPLGLRTVTHKLEETRDTPLGRSVAEAANQHPGLTGIHPLNEGRAAFAARASLARAATRSLDVQYYIWKEDLAGSLMLREMYAAAERGVRVRMLLDDNGITGLDAKLAALDRHPNVEVRLFNPFVIRRPKMIGYLVDFARLNRRMHNKSFTADNQVTIIGGRNVGDEYFGARDDGLFADLDVLAIGSAVNDVSSEFDRYWSSASAYPATTILPDVGPEQARQIASAAALASKAPATRAYLEALRSLPFVAQLQAGTLAFEWARVRLVSDDPAKILGRAGPKGMLTAKLAEILGRPQRQVDLVSGYFVPTQAGEDEFVRLAKNGVTVNVLSNAFETTDVSIVHAGYAGRRKALLRAGVRLFEMRRMPSEVGRRSVVRLGFGSRGGRGVGGPGTVLRSSASTLHAKTFSIDSERIFVGSFNFDPRSMHLNTELGFVIESSVLASRLHEQFASRIPDRAYEVQLTEGGDLVWIERTRSRTICHSVEPGTTRTNRGLVAMLAYLPIEWLL